MGSGKKRGYWDLNLIILLSTIYLFIILLDFKGPVLRVVTGFFFLFFFPGYSLTSALWPKKDRTTSDTSATSSVKQFRISQGPRITKLKKKEKEDTDIPEQEEGVVKDYINNATRLGLSVGLSLGITATAGILSNALYRFDRHFFGLNEIPILFILYFFIIVVSLVATLRRNRTDPDSRFTVQRIKMRIFDKNPVDRIITSVLIVMILISLGYGYYMMRTPGENDKFTEFFILGPEEKIGEYPKFFYREQEQLIFLGVANHEYQRVDYGISISLEKRENPESTDDFQNVTLGPSKSVMRYISLDHNDEFREPFSFNLNESGYYVIVFELLKDNRTYRDLSLEVIVFDHEQMKTSRDGDLKIFLLGEDSDPNSIPTSIQMNNTLRFNYGIVYTGNRSVYLNVSLSIGEAENWVTYRNSTYVVLGLNNTGIYRIVQISGRTQYIIPLEVNIAPGTHVLGIHARNNPRFNFNRTINVWR